MKTYMKLLGAALMAMVVFASCTDDHDNPPIYQPATDQDIIDSGYQIITIAEMKDRFYAEYPNYDSGADAGGFGKGIQIDEAVAIKGKVISTDFNGNIYRSIYLQDATGAMEVKIGLTGMFTDYPVGKIVYVKAKNLFLGNYRFNLSLGGESADAKYGNGFIDVKSVIRNAIHVGEYVGLEAADTVVINAANVADFFNTGKSSEVTYSDGTKHLLNNDKRYIGCLVRFEGLESIQGKGTDSAFNDEYPSFLHNKNTGEWATYTNYVFRTVIEEWTKYETGVTAVEPDSPRPGTESPQDPDKTFIDVPTWAFKNDKESYYGTSLWRLNGKEFSVRTSGYANFALQPLPVNGEKRTITGIMSRYAASGGGYKCWQIALNGIYDVEEFN